MSATRRLEKTRSPKRAPRAPAPGVGGRRGREEDSAPIPVLASVYLEMRSDGVAVITFDHPDSSANVFNPESLTELEGHLDTVATYRSLRGLVLTSAKDGIFVAGADLDWIGSATAEEVTGLIAQGQRVFDKLARLDLPTAAVIHGACLGGGLELALACDWRLASPDKATKIGLPETSLGIVPAWGGCTRLPRLVGLPTALQMILGGKPVGAKRARQMGLVDELGPREHLVLAACERVGRLGKRRRRRHLLNRWPLSRLVRHRASRELQKRSRGNYPALGEAIDLVYRGRKGSVAASLERERRAVLRLFGMPETRELLRAFQLREAARRLRVSDDWDSACSGGRAREEAVPDLHRCAVVGAGVMGAGIAQWLVSREHPVLLQEVSSDRLSHGLRGIRSGLDQGVRRGALTPKEAARALDRLTPVTDHVPLQGVDLVIEAAVEDLEIKRGIFRELSHRVRPDTILATNTSALPISQLARDPEVRHAERVIGLHFFNPVPRMPLVEVVVTDFTSPEMRDTAVRFVQKLGKLPVVVRDRPGFLVNRILMPYLVEAGRLVEAGLDPVEIDEAMLDFGMPMGPLRLLDEVGLDVALAVAGTLEQAFGARLSAPPLLHQLVEAGHLGRKSGLGFYDYQGKRQRRNPTLAVDAQGSREALHATRGRAGIAERLSLLMSNEAFRVLEEGIVSLGEQVDFGMIFGAGYAPFRGGPVRYAASQGFVEVCESLESWRKELGEAGEAYAPAALLRRSAATVIPADDTKRKGEHTS